MLRPLYVKKKLEDGTQLEIRVKFVDGKFLLDDIGVKPKGKRMFRYVCGSSLTDDYSYRKLDSKGRRQMELEKMLEVATLDMLNEALQEAWLSLKPSRLELE